MVQKTSSNLRKIQIKQINNQNKKKVQLYDNGSKDEL